MVQPEVESHRRKVCKAFSRSRRAAVVTSADRMKGGPTDAGVEHGSDRLNLGLIVAVALSIEFWVALSTFFLSHV
jgi:hypothetical protein